MQLRAVFWDLDGTLIDSEPYWHDSELHIAREHGGFWSNELSWQYSGKTVEQVAERMIQEGTQLSVPEIGAAMVEYVAEREMEHMPWIDGVLEVLESLKEAGIPCVLVTSSPAKLVQRVLEQAPEGVFAGAISSDDVQLRKPEPEPYLAAARLLGIDESHMPYCVVMEDSVPGITAGVRSGATTIVQTGFNEVNISQCGHFAQIDTYEGLTAERLNEYVCNRIAQLQEESAAQS